MDTRTDDGEDRPQGQREPTLDELLDAVLSGDPTTISDLEEIDTDTGSSQTPCGVPVSVDVPRREIVDFLRDNPVFTAMTETDLDAFASRMSCVRYASDDLICRDGDPGDEMWIVRDGGMRVSKRGQTVVCLSAGAPAGEMSVLGGKPRSTDLYALGNPLLFVLTREAYAEVFRTNVDAGSRFVRNIAEIQQTRLRDTTRQAIDNAVAAERARSEIHFVKEIQDLALAKNRLPVFGNSDIHVSYKGAREVSGDYYDFVEFPDHPGQLIVIMGDAMGHGLPAGIQMLLAKCASYMQLGDEPCVEKIMTAINNITCQIFEARMFMTLVGALIDRDRHTIRYANAGHQCHPYLFRQATRVLVALASQSPELGVTPSAAFPSEEIEYDDGDLLLFYSDAITEAPFCPPGATEVDRIQQYGDDRLREFIAKNARLSARDFAEGLDAEVRAFCRFYDGYESIGGEDVDGDDATIIAIRLD